MILACIFAVAFCYVIDYTRNLPGDGNGSGLRLPGNN